MAYTALAYNTRTHLTSSTASIAHKSQDLSSGERRAHSCSLVAGGWRFHERLGQLVVREAAEQDERAAELRLETFVTVELTLDNLPLTLRAHVDDDPGKAAELFCKDVIPLSLACKDRFAAALRAEQAAVRIRTGRVKPPEPRKQVPAPPKLVWLSEPMARAPSKNVALSIAVGGRRLHVEAGVDEPPHAAVAHPPRLATRPAARVRRAETQGDASRRPWSD